MGKGFKGKTCVYCAAAPAATMDHVFAREFFLVDRRANLPKVPACQACNSAKSGLEHYLTRSGQRSEQFLERHAISRSLSARSVGQNAPQPGQDLFPYRCRRTAALRHERPLPANGCTRARSFSDSLLSRNSRSARSASASSKGRSCRHCSDHRKSQAGRNSASRHRTRNNLGLDRYTKGGGRGAPWFACETTALRHKRSFN